MSLQVQLNYVEKKELRYKGKIYIGSPLGTEEDINDRFLELNLPKDNYIAFSINAKCPEYMEGDCRAYICGVIPADKFNTKDLLLRVNEHLAKPGEIIGQMSTRYGFFGIYDTAHCFDWSDGPFDKVVMHGFVDRKGRTDIYFETAGCKNESVDVHEFHGGFIVVVRPNYEMIGLVELDENTSLIVKELEQRTLDYPENKEIESIIDAWMKENGLTLIYKEIEDSTLASIIVGMTDELARLSCKSDGIIRTFPLQFTKYGKCSKGALMYELYKSLQYSKRMNDESYISINNREVPIDIKDVSPTPKTKELSVDSIEL